MTEFLQIRGALEAPIPDDFSFLYVSVRSALCFDVLRFRDHSTSKIRTDSYGEAVPGYRRELQGVIDSAFAGKEYTGELPIGATMGPDFIRAFIANLNSIGYSSYQQRAYLQRLFKEVENSSDGAIVLHSRPLSRGISEDSHKTPEQVEENSEDTEELAS